MHERCSILDQSIAFDPQQDLDAFLKQVPAKWVVYLFADENDQPIQLLCVKNLRASLKRRLGSDEMIGPTKRVNYRELVRRVYWRRVDSAFEADYIYLDAARAIFPQTYKGMIGFRPAWFVHVNPDTNYPRYVKTIDPTGRTGTYFGPIEDKHAAQKLVHSIESLFDLCRDYSILIQSPHAGPCAWKQMGKCVGPCDGTISLEAYQQLVAFSAKVLADPSDYIREQTRRMEQAATELQFETAAKIKQYIEQLSKLGKGPLRHVRPLERFTYVTLQRGPRESMAKLFLIMPGVIEHLLCLIDSPQQASSLLRPIFTLAGERISAAIDEAGAERIGVVSHHLFSPKQTQGVFIPLEKLDEKTLARAYRDLQKQKVQQEAEEEGVLKELQAM